MPIVLLDADVIIDLHKLGIWDTIAKKNEILIPSTVLRREAYYYEDEFGYKHSIELLKKERKTYKEVPTKADDVYNFKHKFVRFIEEELDLGETEALKILNDRDDCFFCTCDKVAIKAIALLGKRDQGLSFEKLLQSCGITKKLNKRHTEQYFQKYLDEGSVLRIQRFGFSD